MKVLPIFLPLLLPAVTGCEKPHDPIAVTLSPNYKKGVALLNERHDSAYYYLNKAATESKDSLQIAQAYNVMAVIQTREGDYYGGQESLLTSLKFLHADRENDQYCLVADYNVLGNNNLNLKNYDAAIAYYRQALQYARDGKSKAIALNNIAVAYQKKGAYAQAITLYDSILPASKPVKKEYARVMSNLARARWLQDSGYRAASEFLEALQMRKEENDLWGLNASYSHLADYYTHSRPDSALGYARAMYSVARGLNSPDDEMEALEKLILLSPAKDVKPFFARYRQLKDSLETARNNAKNQFALIRYDAEKNKTDNLRLQRENAERKVEVVQQRAISIGVIAVFAVLTGWVVLWYRKRKQKLEWEKERAKQEERIQISHKIHDKVANRMYRLLAAIEHGGDVDREQLLDELEALYLLSRDISYEPTGASGDDFAARMANILAPYGRPGRKVLITGNDIGIWEDIGSKTKRAMEPILEELMVNMDKHSGARNVVVRFEREGKGLKLSYSDDGVGFPSDMRYGNGLTSTGNRISAIGGRLIFEPNNPSGVRILIYFPND